MVWIYLCKACEEGRHGECELGHPSPKGSYGGSLCRCPCKRNADWNSPAFIEAELRDLVQKMLDHKKASEQLIEKLPELGGGKIELKKE